MTRAIGQLGRIKHREFLGCVPTTTTVAVSHYNQKKKGKKEKKKSPEKSFRENEKNCVEFFFFAIAWGQAILRLGCLARRGSQVPVSGHDVMTFFAPKLSSVRCVMFSATPLFFVLNSAPSACKYLWAIALA
jgi:hypothetical protein